MSLPVHLVTSLTGTRAGDDVTVEGDEAHHAVAVRRLRVGESVLLTDGAGTAAVGVVAATGKRVFTVTVSGVERSAAPRPALTVVQAVPKGDRGELAVEVLTEIGVTTIVPWAASRSVAVWKGERGAKALSRWRSTAREAAKQARRTWHPVVTDPATLDDLVHRVGAVDLAVVLHEDAEATLAEIDIPTDGDILVVVGPEGGLTTDELDALEAAGARTVRLGAEVLRTSTAGLAATAAILSRTPRWGSTS